MNIFLEELMRIHKENSKLDVESVCFENIMHKVY